MVGFPSCGLRLCRAVRRVSGFTAVAVVLASSVCAIAQDLPSAPSAVKAQMLSEANDASLPAQDARQTQATTSMGASGNIMGTILDPSGAVAVGAKVHLSANNGALSQDVASGSNGQFSFAEIPAGTFQLTVSAPGFTSQSVSGQLASGQTYLVPAIVLPIGRADTEVRVTESTVEVAEQQIHEEEHQRALGFIPNFYVSYVPDAAPLNTQQKFQLAWRTVIDPVTFVGAAFYAGLEQAGDRYPEYGQGLEGYSKRFGQSYGAAFSGIFISDAILPSVFKQDPRYFYKGTGSKKSRLLYALASPVICKGDNKKWEPNYSFVLGSIASGGISQTMLPANERDGVGLIFENALIRIGEGSIGGVIQEFIVRHLTPKSHRGEPTQGP